MSLKAVFSAINPKYLFNGRRVALAIVGDNAGWSFDHEARELCRVMSYQSGANPILSKFPCVRNPAFFVSRSMALRNIRLWRSLGVSVNFPYFHGYPGEGEPEFDEIYRIFRKNHGLVSRVQVTHRKMEELLLETGVGKDKLKLIRIGVDSSKFVQSTTCQRFKIRSELGIPQSAVVIGSFQKDGVGWEEGDIPKLIKGPDILIQTIRILKQSIPELFVLLSGAARGYVKRGLEFNHIPYKHIFVKNVDDLPRLYSALDTYVVTSRQEGGPKAILESMAAGVPIISTKVGQATELIRHGENGWLAEVGDAEALAGYAVKTIRDSGWIEGYREKARVTAVSNDYLSQKDLWKDFFAG